MKAVVLVTACLLVLQVVEGNPAIGHLAPAPHLTSSSQTIRVALADSVRLPCDVQNLGNFMVVWNKLRESETKLLAAGSTKVIRDGRFSVEGTSIRITDVQPRDSGVYVCEINTDVPLNITVVLDVLEPAQVRRFPEEGLVLASKGESVKLECLGEGNPMPTIQWSKPGRLLSNGAETLEGPVLNFNAVGRQEVGVYQCTADNGVSAPAAATIELRVQYPPEIEIERSWIHTGLHQESLLTCFVHAEPPANVLWYRDDRVIVPSDTRILGTSNNKHTLILRNVQENDFGFYSCNADNKLGRSSQNIELSGRPSRSVFKSEPMGMSVDSYNLTWKIDSFAPIEEYKLMFRKLQINESEDLNRTWNSVIIPKTQKDAQSKHHREWFLLDHLDTGAMYEATVTAKNRYGTSEMSEAFQFFTLGPEYIPNVKNLEVKDIGGMESGSHGKSGAARCAVLSSALVAMATLLVQL